LFLGDDTDGYSCPQARADAVLYRVVTLTGYTERELEDCSADFIARLLRADGPYHEAARIQQERAARPG
jgi:hypothetical protein